MGGAFAIASPASYLRSDRTEKSPGVPSLRETNDAPRLYPLADLLAAFDAEAIAARDAFTTGKPRGPQTRFGSLDTELGGALQPGLHILHAGPGIGKTALALQIAATCGFPALYLTAEMAALELLRRVIARTTGTFLGKLKTGELAPAIMAALARQAISQAPCLSLADATQSHAEIEWLRGAAAKVRGDAPGALIVVDSVHSWVESADTGLTEYEALNAGLNGLRQLAGDVGCPILAIAERNRASMNGGGVNAAAGSRRFEYGSETVIDLARKDSEAKPDPAGEVEVTLTLAKNRHGAAGRRFPLKFNGALQRFREA